MDKSKTKLKCHNCEDNSASTIVGLFFPATDLTCMLVAL